MGLDITKRIFNRRRVGERFMDISLQKVEYRYQANTPFERLAIKRCSIDIPDRYLFSYYWSYGFREINCSATFKCSFKADQREK